MKTLEKSEMLERNKVGRVLTEEGILNQGQLQILHSVLHLNHRILCTSVVCVCVLAVCCSCQQGTYSRQQDKLTC